MKRNKRKLAITSTRVLKLATGGKREKSHHCAPQYPWAAPSGMICG